MNPSPGHESFYDLLGVSRDASRAQIRAAFLQRAQECHPDLNGQDEAAEIRFREIRFAYEVLHDKRKRGEYDQNPNRFHQQKQSSEWQRTGGTSAGRTSARWEPSPHRFRSTRPVSTRLLAAVLGTTLLVFSLGAAALVTLVLEGDHRRLLDFAHIRVAGESEAPSEASSTPFDSRISIDELAAHTTALGPIRVDDTVVQWRGSTSLNQLVAPIDATAPPLESVAAAQKSTPLDPRSAESRSANAAGGSANDSADDRFGKQADAFLPRVQHSMWIGPGDSSRTPDSMSSPMFFNPPATPTPLSPVESGAAALASMASRIPLASAEEWSVPVVPLELPAARPASGTTAAAHGNLPSSPWTSPVAWRETQAGVDWSHFLMSMGPTSSSEERPVVLLLSLQSSADRLNAGYQPGMAGIDLQPAGLGRLSGNILGTNEALVSCLPGMFVPTPWSPGHPLVNAPAESGWVATLPTFENLWTRPSLASLGRIVGAAPKPSLRVPSNLPSSGLTLGRLQLPNASPNAIPGIPTETSRGESPPATFSHLRNTSPPLGSTLRSAPRREDYSGVASRSMVRETPPGAAWINLRPSLPRTGTSFSAAVSVAGSAGLSGSDTSINPTTGLAGVTTSQPPRGLTHPGKWPPQPIPAAPPRSQPGNPLGPSLRYTPTISSSSIYPPLYSF